MLEVKNCAPCHSMHAGTHIQVAIFQISFPHEAHIQYVREETSKVMIKKRILCAPGCAYLCLFAPTVVP